MLKKDLIEIYPVSEFAHFYQPDPAATAQNPQAMFDQRAEQVPFGD